MKKSSCPRREAKVGPIDMIRPPLAPLEFEALSLLLGYWATTEPSKGRGLKLANKLPIFRAAVISGMGQGVREKGVPAELATAEYRVILRAMQWVRKNQPTLRSPGKRVQWLRRARIPCGDLEGENEIIFERPVPIATKAIACVSQDLTGNYRPSEIAREVTAKRLGCSAKKVKNAVRLGRSGFKVKSRNCEKPIEVSSAQALLISILFDLCSSDDEGLPLELLAKILAVLFSTGCHLLVIYYVIQRAHALTEKLYVGHYDLSEVERLCAAVCPEVRELNYRPFVRLTDGR